MNTALFSYYIIPFITLRLARGTEYLHSNFSTIRSVFERHLEFLAWCAITGLYFYLAIRRLYGYLPKKKRKNRLPAVAAGLLFCSALLPYFPETLPILSALHLITAFTASVLLFLCLFQLSFQLYFTNPPLGRPMLLLLLASVFFCLAAWIRSGIINTAMEVCLVLTACILIRRLSLVFERYQPFE